VDCSLEQFSQFKYRNQPKRFSLGGKMPKHLLFSRLARPSSATLRQSTYGWGESDSGRQAKFYRLSAKGRKQLAAEESNWQRLAGAVSLIMQTEQ